MERVFYNLLIFIGAIAVLSGCSSVSNIVKNEFSEKNPEDILENTAAEYIVNSTIGGTTGECLAGQMELLKTNLSLRMGDSVMIRQPEEGVLLVFDSDRLFNNGTARIKDNSLHLLQNLAESLIHFPNTKVYILVHTDNSSSEFIALSLSDKRARCLKRLLAGLGLKRSHITAEGRGFMVPVISNETPDGRKLNRRVEIAVVANNKMILKAIKSTKATR